MDEKASRQRYSSGILISNATCFSASNPIWGWDSDINCWQIQGKLRTLNFMSEGVVRYFCIAVLGTVPMLSAADELLPPSLPGANPSLVATNVAPIVIAPTNNPAEGVLPIVGGGTNTVLTAEERRNAELEEARKQAEEAYQKKLSDAKEKWKAATNNLGDYHLIPEKNPFRLKMPEIQKPGPIVPKTPMTIGVPHLAGISMLRDKMRAVLRINPLKGGAAEYKFIPVGEMVDGVEVMKIDAVNGVVEVKVKGKTHPLELDKNTLASFKSTARRPSGSSFRQGSSRSSGTPPRGGSSSSRGTSGRDDWRKKMEEARKKRDSSGSRATPQKPSGSSGKGGLDRVPSRRRLPKSIGGQSNLDEVRPNGSDLYELPAFNEVVQKRVIDPLNISTQREIIRGQISYETPTDLPGDKR